MPPTSRTTSCRTRSSTHCEQIIRLDSIVQVEREDCADAIRLLDVLRLAEALCVAEVDEDAATYIAYIVQAEVICQTRPSLSCSSAQPATRLCLARHYTLDFPFICLSRSGDPFLESERVWNRPAQNL